MTIDWGRVYDTHAYELAVYLARLVGDVEAGRDLLHDTFVRALRSSDTIREPGAVRAWLYRTATNLGISHRRRQRLLACLPFAGTEPASGTAFDADAYLVRAALRAIPADQVATLLLVYESGFRRAEVADLLQVSEETVKSRLARGRANFIAAHRRLERGLAR